MNSNPTSYGGNAGGQGQPPQTYQETVYASNQPGSYPNNSYNPNPYGPNPNPYGAPPPSNPGNAPYDPYGVPPTVAATPPPTSYGAPPPANPYSYPNQAPPAPNQGTPYPYPNNAPPATPYVYPGSVPPPSYPGTPPPPAPRSSGNKVVLIVLAVLVVLGGLVAAIGISAHNTQVATDNAHATATAQAKVTATAQVKATATAVASTYPFSSNLKLNDPLTDNSKGMGWMENSGCKFEADGYHAIGTEPNTYYTCPALKANFTDFTYQVSMKMTQGNLAGISFRGDNDQYKYYTFVFRQNDSKYWLLLYTQKDQRPQDLYIGSTPYFTANTDNQLGVVARGGKITLYVNGHELTSTTDSTLTSGQIGAVVYNGQNQGDTIDVVYSNLKVWQL